jgi:hypothetical protein
MRDVLSELEKEEEEEYERNHANSEESVCDCGSLSPERSLIVCMYVPVFTNTCF